MPSLVQVIEKGDPAPVGLFGQHAAIIEINGQPGIAAGAGRAIIFRKGVKVKVVAEEDMLTALMEEVENTPVTVDSKRQ